ncbi:isopropylmalate/homocitrate/citramalate synthase [Mesobaculum littorinae]|uniref:Isopropylmalate/homocitrate/citramalate synthase n=1 Tax=Mesobaculum littorinae TaxID=2486419 RepID=A0A438AM56_9RHOB|nr:nuclear transport factor 2 family protein [Mesobaculum littorinae]RVV99921.1 isopropylmalate/homocitrate/citramalate synthase [Mesobaculum littorinae]
MSRDLIRHYFKTFNEGDADGMAALVTEDVAHHVNQGEVRHGRDAFRRFLGETAEAYAERVESLVIFEGDKPGRYAAEFTINGVYKATQDGLPAARGQRYVLPVGSFFEVRGDGIARVSTHYNLIDWIEQVNL